MPEQLLDVRGSVRLIGRSWRLVAALMMLGAGGVLAHQLTSAPRYSASALVLIPSAPTAAPGPATQKQVTTDVRVALSADVLVPAARSAGRHLTYQEVAGQVSAAPAAPGVVRITAVGSTRSSSERLANAVASQLVDFTTATNASSGSHAASSLEAEAAQLKTQLDNVTKELATVRHGTTTHGTTPTTTSATSSTTVPGTTAGTDTQLANQLSAQKSALSLQIDSVDSQIAEVQLGLISQTQGTKLIQHATTAAATPLSSLIVPVLLGALGGLFVGALFVLVRHRRDARIRTRDGLADAIGSPVVLALDVRPRAAARDWVTMFDSYEPSAVEQWGVRKALRELGVHELGGDLQVLCFDRDRAGVTLGAEMAIASAVAGCPTAFSVVADQGLAASLRFACEQAADEEGGPRANLQVGGDLAGAADSVAGLTVTAVVLDVEHPDVGCAPRRKGATTVISVSAGFASADQLARAAIAAADRGCRISGVLVANPAADDQTSGRPARSGARSALVDLDGGSPPAMQLERLR